ncbi:hypothetical protein HN51_057094 [Arachis hypogaea]|uniref:Branchpoint-bridging protein n=1 Tax=Arachis hypogaea TaxID=3818 RepID=A0A6B9VHJ0_ARAHY|nr:Branchpoint-bridging protein [Arachis hypogaea]QHN80112.1 Branchpoint-bridging protein [Arachis hypogaea]
MPNKLSNSLNDINKRSKKESCIEKLEKHIVQNPSDRVGNSMAQFEDLPEEDPEEEELCEELEEDPEEESASEVEDDPHEESAEELEEDPEEELVEEDPEEESTEEVEEDPNEESAKELEEDQEEESAEELEEDPEEESAEELEEDVQEESAEELEEDPEEESAEELEEDVQEESAEELEEDPEEESGEEVEEDVQEESVKEVEEDPEEESAEELEEDPEEESAEELEEDVQEESAEELEEDPEEESAEELEEDVQEESAEELEEDPEEESGEEVEEDVQEESVKEVEEDPEEESAEELEEDPEEESTEELEEDPEEDPVVNIKWEGASCNEVPLLSQASYQSQKKCKQEGTQSQNLEPEASRLELSSDKSISVATTDKVGSKEEVSGRSAKQRRSRWEPQPRGDGTNDDLTCKRRKTRWSSEETQMKMLGPLQLPNLNIISKLMTLNPDFNPPPEYKPPKLLKKLYIPVKEYPEYNFIGLIIGPRGNTQKKMEKESGATILLRGKGSSKATSKCDSEEEDLHVLIEADNQKSLDAAVGMVEKLLIPVEEGQNEHKREQLKELAQLKATRRDENVCSVCGDKGHRHYACPNLSSTFNFDLFDTGCSSSLSIPTYPATALFPPNSNFPCGSGTSLNSVQNRQIRPGKEINDKNLYVGYLPPSIDKNRLIELFSPFGKITEADVIKDRTTGISKGYGFVKYEDSQDAALAIMHLNGFRIDGKFLKVRIAGLQANNETPSLNLIPQIPLPATVSTNVIHQTNLSDPLHFMLPEYQSSFHDSSSTNMFPCNINSEDGDPLKVNALLTPHPGYSGYFSDQSLFSSKDSTEHFPGDPGNLGNFSPFL